jgi:class 3 adenylate cyclase/PAS domain-containing protein
MRKPVIICVDDELTILDSLKIELKKSLGDEYLIETAEGGEDALELIEEVLEDHYEIALVISDYLMPKVKGDELLKRIHEISPKTLKILLTGQADLEAVGNAIKYAKLYRYIAKPWQTEDLSLTVKEAINSYLQDKKLAQQNVKLQQMNQALEQLNGEQAALIAKLHENESRLAQFLEAMPVGVTILDASGKPYYANHRAQQLLGKGVVPDATFKQIPELYQVYRAGTAQKYPLENLSIVRALRGERATADDIEIHQGDKIIPLEEWGTPIFDEKGNIAYAIVAFQDITERKKAEAERIKFTNELFQLNKAYERFVPGQFLQFLDKSSIVDVQLGDQVQKEMSVLFSDIRDFTTLSERMTPEENFRFINSYLSHMGPVISDHHGFIDKYIGDAIMALFSGTADDAVKAGIAMLQRLVEYNQQRANSGYMPIQIGIGINTGSLMLGTVGEQNRMDSTVISNAVNLASRIEGLTKSYGVSLLISDHTFLRLQNSNEYAIRIIDRVKVKGKSEMVSVFEVFDADPPEIFKGKSVTRTAFEQALLVYYQQSFSAAAQRLEDVLRINPRDKVAQIYLQRCQGRC